MGIDYTHANAAHLTGAAASFAHLFQRVLLDAYFPEFRERLIEVKLKAALRGTEAWSLAGYRSFPEQDALHRLYLAGKGGRAAPAGLSAHNYGLADDSAVDASTASGLQPSWKADLYATLGEEAQAAGLVWGASFNDRPHIQWPHFVTATELKPLQIRWVSMSGTSDERLQCIWQEIRSGA